jgi:hypothetical protein
MGRSEQEEREMIDSHIGEHGCHVVRVMEDDIGPGFSYTIGLHQRFGHPELIVVGLPGDLGAILLNIAARALIGGARYESGREYDDFLQGYSCTFREIPTEKYPSYFGFAIWFYGGAGFPAMQLIYPDRNRRWPWEEGVDEAFIQEQPLIAVAPPPGS